MGLNLNYSLLKEGSNLDYRIKAYTKGYSCPVVSESYLMEAGAEFSNELREASRFLTNLVSVDESAEVVITEGVFANIVAGIKEIIGKVIEAIKKLAGVIIDAFKKLIATIRGKAIESKVDNKFKGYDKDKLLLSALSAASVDEKTVAISDIHPTVDLMGNDFPDTSVIGGELTDKVREALGIYCFNIMGPKNGNPAISQDADAAEGLANYVYSEQDKILKQIFGKYSFDSTDISGSAKRAADLAFGSSERKDTLIDINLFKQAEDNLSKGPAIIKDLEKVVDDVSKNYRAIMRDLNKARNTANIITKREEKDRFRNTYKQEALRLVANVNNIVNMVNVTIRADFDILMHKYKRASQVFSTIYSENSGHSQYVKTVCYRLIDKYTNEEKISESSLSSRMLGGYNSNNFNVVVSGLEAVAEDYALQEDFDIMMRLIEESWNEQEYSMLLESVILEEGEGDAKPAEGGDSAAASGDTKPTTSTATNAANAVKNAANKASGALSGLIKKIIETFEGKINSFKDRINSAQIKVEDGKFFNQHRERIKNADFGATMVNQWYSYDFDALAKSIVPDFDISNEAFKDDKATQELILQAIPKSNDVEEKEEDTFSQRVAKRFYRKYTDDPNGAKALNTIDGAGINTAMFNYVDEFLNKGFNGATLGSIQNDRKKIDTNYKNAQNNMQQNLDKMKTDNAEQKAEQPATGEAQKPGGNASGQVGQKTEVQQNSASIADDFRFNLAENFGLYTKKFMAFDEAEITGVPNLADGEEGAAAGEGGGESKNKELDARMTRYFKYSTYAVSAKMTAVVAAYHQYMNLYRLAFNQTQKKPENKEGQNNNQQQNQQQQKPAEK